MEGKEKARPAQLPALVTLPAFTLERFVAVLMTVTAFHPRLALLFNRQKERPRISHLIFCQANIKFLSTLKIPQQTMTKNTFNWKLEKEGHAGSKHTKDSDRWGYQMVGGK